MAKKVRKQKQTKIIVDPERKGTVRSRDFGVVDKGKLSYVVTVAHVKEKGTGRGESFITQKDDGPLKLHQTKKSVARAFPRITPKLPMLR